MYQQAIARRYAKGLMLAANESDLDRIEEELGMLTDVLSENSDLYRLFEDPSILPRQRRSVLNSIAMKSNMNRVLHFFLLLLAAKDRITLLPFIHEALVGFIDNLKGRLRATIKSASPLDATFVSDIKDALSKVSKKEVLAKTLVDEELLGGVRVEMGGVIFDGTAKAKLATLKSKLLYDVGTV